MKNIVIKGKWVWFWLFFISLGLNITLIKLSFHFEFMPLPDREVTEAFNRASSDVVAPRTFTLKWMNKYYILIETTKEGKDMLEKIERKK